jgi:DNA-binding transcriptional MerR regulator
MSATATNAQDQPRFRSAAVARMLGMPVETLRVWERRYGLVSPARSSGGQRMYSAAQVQRLALLRQLTQCGHPIGNLAGLGAEALAELARQHAQLLQAQRGAVDAAWRATKRAAQAEPPIPPRRWGDAALADFAGLSSTLACECPRHLAQLVQGLAEFEDYSAQCMDLNPQDAALHAHLRQITAQARHTFEQALERVALHEGLLPPT